MEVCLLLWFVAIVKCPHRSLFLLHSVLHGTNYVLGKFEFLGINLSQACYYVAI